jgi:general secretion pathway protein D/MSHA biogenesis protein MshL
VDGKVFVQFDVKHTVGAYSMEKGQLVKPKKMSGKKSMLAKKRILLAGIVVSALLLLSGCASTATQQQSAMEPSLVPELAASETMGDAVAGAPREGATNQPVQQEGASVTEAEAVPTALPVRFQKPSYFIKDIGVGEESGGSQDEELSLQVGADIMTTAGPVPLREIMKSLGSLHNMNVSWASDVDQYVYIDVDIRARDDFFTALDNMLRQVDYFYELQGNTIIIKFKETRKFHVDLPPRIKGQANINTTGGTTTNTEADNSRWEIIRENLDQILSIWAKRYKAPASAKPEEGKEEEATPVKGATITQTESGFYSVDPSLGLITITAPRPLLDKIQIYVDTLKDEMYKQITIEAKILEVTLEKSAEKGIDWSGLFKDSAFNFNMNFGAPTATPNIGQIYPDSGGVIDSITVAAKSFDLVLDALEDSGTTKVLANPRISVMNGQPAVIYVGDNITYISEVETTTDEGTVTTSATTAQVVSGLRLEVYATIMSDDEIVMSIIPMISELEEPIEYRQFGLNHVGLPFVRERTMNSMVRLNNGEMLIVGGLISSVEIDESSNIVGLGKIPGLKYIFGNKEDTLVRKELVILLRPRII